MTSSNRKTVFTVRFNSRELEALQKVAEEREVSVAEVIRLCVNQTLIPVNKPKDLSEIGIAAYQRWSKSPIAQEEQSSSDHILAGGNTVLSRDTFPSKFAHIIKAIVKNPADIVSRKISVESVTLGAMSLFGVLDDPSGERWRWEDLSSKLLLENKKWVEEFLKFVDSLTSNEIFQQRFQSTFQSSEGKLYTTFINRNTLNDDLIEISVVFAEQIGKGFVANAPNESLATLVTAINLGCRLQWEVCEKYRQKLEHWQSNDKEEIQKILKQISGSFENIEIDAEFRRKNEVSRESDSNKMRLIACFESEEDRRRIEYNLGEQDPHKATLLNVDTLDNVDGVNYALTELSRLNVIVMDMVSKRFHELYRKTYSGFF